MIKLSITSKLDGIASWSLEAGVTCSASYANDGKCSGCRACWDKTIPVIAYIAHGQKMLKLIKQTLDLNGLID